MNNRIKKTALSSALILLAAMLIFQLSLCSFAVKLDILNYRNGNTYLETFVTSTENDTVYNEFVELITSQTSLIAYDSDLEKIYLVDIDSTDNVTVGVNSAGLCYIFADTAGDGFGGQGWDINGENIVYSSKHFWTPGTTLSNVILLGGLALDDIDILYADGMDDTYIADIEGQLIIVDDRENGSDDNTGSSGEDDESGGILGFLGDFWDKFKSFLLGLFVPTEDYFKNWYSEIKSAFDKKFGALTEFYNTLTGFFDGVDTSSSTSGIFADSLFSDWLDWLRDVITGLILILTVYVCYRRIIALISI